MRFHHNGLSATEVQRSRSEHGTNELPAPEPESFMSKLLENFEDPLIRILLVALGVTCVLAFFGFADWIEGVGIAVAVFLATFVSTYSEYKNEEQFKRLQYEASRVRNNVFRDGQLQGVLVGDVVKGDVCLLQAGDRVPGDGHLLEGTLMVDQSTLTGEPHPERKDVLPRNVKLTGDEPFSDHYTVFRGSVIDEGEAVVVIDRVGQHTSYGRLALELAEDDDRESPLQHKLGNLADAINKIGYIGAAFIFLSFLFKQLVMDQGYSLQATLAYVQKWQLALKDVTTSLILAIIIIVVAVPEGLPMMIAIVLSMNMRKLLRANVLVRKLLGIETAGSMNILFVDKTGTITRGRFHPQCIVAGDGASFATHATLPRGIATTLSFAIRESTSTAVSPDGSVRGGNATDRALMEFLDPAERVIDTHCSVVTEVQFGSAHKFSAVNLEVPPHASLPLPTGLVSRQGRITVVKGAAEVVLKNCSAFLTEKGVVRPLPRGELPLLDVMQRLAAQSMRIVAVAVCQAPLSEEERVMPTEMTLIGLLGVKDEVRPESAFALRQAREAGIHVVMVTGDSLETATAVATEIGLLNDSSITMDGDELKSVSESVLEQRLRSGRLHVIARARPADKSKLVKVAQSIGLVVGMTGDGVNDSAALKKADVGFAMGSGSEVSKEAADIVILDDNFASITRSVLYGRTIFRSIRKFVVFQSTINLASCLIVFLGPFLGFDFPLTLIQLLWVNLVMDTLAALAFGGEPALERYMSEQPTRREEAIITPYMWSSIFVVGLFIAASCIGVLTSDWVPLLFQRDGKPSEPAFLTAFFCFFIFQTVFNAFNVRTRKLNLLENIGGNRGFVLTLVTIFVVQVAFTYVGGRVLRTVMLMPGEWALVIAAASVVIPVDLLRKVALWLFRGSDKGKAD